jgi:DNA-binding PadR family transcriptional regulator
VDTTSEPWGRPERRHRHHPHHPHQHPAAFADEPGREHRRPGGRGRAPRGDVRTAVLLLLAQEPMHGYQLMQAIAERTGGTWTPSPGAIYPTINQLEDEGLVAVTADAGRRLVRLTASGRELLATSRDSWVDPFAGFDPNAPGSDLRRLMHELHEATRQVGRAGTDAQRQAAAKILTEARRELYLLLAAGPGTPEA